MIDAAADPAQVGSAVTAVIAAAMKL